MKPFEYIINITEKTSYVEDLKDYSVYVMNKYLSCDEKLVHLAHLLNQYQLTNKRHYDLLWYGVDKKKRYIKYNAAKEKLDKEILYLMKYYQVNSSVAKDYHELLSDEEKNQIYKIYKEIGE